VSGKKKRRSAMAGAGGGPESPELNIVPFIDIFSMLNTFLLVSASFIGLGIIEVQIPFLSNSPDTKELPERSFSIRVDVEENGVLVTSQWTAPPVEKTETRYELTPADIDRLHQDMIALRVKVPENDKVTLYAVDKVRYEKLVTVLDAIKSLKENEPPLNLPNSDPNAAPAKGKGGFVFEKIVIGSVIL
jgi:biopolymer transport protein ExbD